MKKLLIFLFIVLATFSGFGQFNVSPILGINFATKTGRYSENDDTKSKWITGAAFGVNGEYGFTDMICLDMELLFITMGEKTIYTGEGEKSTLSEYEYKETERYHYLQLPILVKFLFGTDFQYYGDIGPYFGYKIAGHYKAVTEDHTSKGRIRFNEDKVKDDDWYENPDYWRRFDMGMYIGGGVQKQVGPGKLGADLRFGMGFIDQHKFDSKEKK